MIYLGLTLLRVYNDRPDLPEKIELKRDEFRNESIRSKIKQANKQRMKKLASF